MGGVRLDVLPPDIRAEMEYDVPRPLGVPSKCTTCMQSHNNHTVYDDVTVTKLRWGWRQPEGHLVVRCRFHQQLWEETH